MAKPRSQSKTDTEPKSEALKNFESNLDGIVFFINETGTKHLQRRLKVLMNLVRKKMKDDVIQTRPALRLLLVRLRVRWRTIFV